MEKQRRGVPWQEVYRRLVEEGPHIPGDAGHLIEGSAIPWINPKLIEDGQLFVAKNGFSVNLAHSGALILGFALKNLTTVLLRTGKFNGVLKSMDRFVDTEEHITPWYKADIFHGDGAGFKEIQVVRKMHALALKKSLELESHGAFVPDESGIEEKEAKARFIQAFRQDIEIVDTSRAPAHLNTYNPPLLMSQYDMAMTQYGFFSLMYMYPDSFGIHDARELDGFVHLWAVIGKMIGIQDRYNLALHPSRELYAKIHDEIGVTAFKAADLTVADLQFAFADALGRMMYHRLSAPALFYFSLNSKALIPDFEGTQLYSLISWREVIMIKGIAFLIFLMCNVGFINRAINDAFPSFLAMNRKKVLGARRKRAAAAATAAAAGMRKSVDFQLIYDYESKLEKEE